MFGDLECSTEKALVKGIVVVDYRCSISNC